MNIKNTKTEKNNKYYSNMENKNNNFDRILANNNSNNNNYDGNLSNNNQVVRTRDYIEGFKKVHGIIATLVYRAPSCLFLI